MRFDEQARAPPPPARQYTYVSQRNASLGRACRRRANPSLLLMGFSCEHFEIIIISIVCADVLHISSLHTHKAQCIKGAASNWKAVNFYWPVLGNANFLLTRCTHLTGASFNLWNFNLIWVLQASVANSFQQTSKAHTLFNCFAPGDLWPCEQTCFVMKIKSIYQKICRLIKMLVSVKWRSVYSFDSWIL